MSVNIADWNFFLKKWWVHWKLRQPQLCHRPTTVGPVVELMATQADEDREKLRTLAKEKEVKYQT